VGILHFIPRSEDRGNKRICQAGYAMLDLQNFFLFEGEALYTINPVSHKHARYPHHHQSCSVFGENFLEARLLVTMLVSRLVFRISKLDTSSLSPAFGTNHSVHPFGGIFDLTLRLHSGLALSHKRRRRVEFGRADARRYVSP
jgi:hypothetical protein